MIDEDAFAEGLMFDGSSIAGWKAINESDMCLMPDPVTRRSIVLAETTLIITCDVLEPTTGDLQSRPARHGQEGEAMVKSMGLATRFSLGRKLSSSCSTTSAPDHPLQHRLQAGFIGIADQPDTEYEGGNLGHDPDQGGLLSGSAAGSVQDMRSEMLGAMAKMGVKSRSITTKSHPPSTNSA